MEVISVCLLAKILVPFTDRGMILEGRRLFTCSPRWLRASFPAAEISAPELDKISMSADPLREEMWTVIVGAGSITVASWTLDMWIHGDPLSSDDSMYTVLVDAWGCAIWVWGWGVRLASHDTP